MYFWSFPCDFIKNLKDDFNYHISQLVNMTSYNNRSFLASVGISILDNGVDPLNNLKVSCNRALFIDSVLRIRVRHSVMFKVWLSVVFRV